MTKWNRDKAQGTANMVIYRYNVIHQFWFWFDWKSNYSLSVNLSWMWNEWSAIKSVWNGIEDGNDIRKLQHTRVHKNSFKDDVCENERRKRWNAFLTITNKQTYNRRCVLGCHTFTNKLFRTPSDFKYRSIDKVVAKKFDFYESQ